VGVGAIGETVGISVSFVGGGVGVVGGSVASAAGWPLQAVRKRNRIRAVLFIAYSFPVTLQFGFVKTKSPHILQAMEMIYLGTNLILISNPHV
jgi:hypothetical protein